ncbi:MAG: flagellar basal body P-ring formation protein FlgA [Salinicola sp.]|uniref:flagellar basal body P-ring formation chaperone FlgA n=1 Tax=Salinicola sp. TaxID=1978524 RepID=UPI001E0C0F7B|nr:flagellar basal body P-ring formation chaperone FlgA [Salinicola sp.]NRB55359.1 flagellar basal body P-ring formation protein FlgA [Salinicola sp.]
MRADPPETFQRCRSKFRPGLRRVVWTGAMTLMALLFALSLLPIPSISQADTDVPPNDAVSASVERFLHQQTASLGDQVKIELQQSAADLGDCPTPQPFLPRPGVPQGRVTVGVHCGGHDNRTRYLQATVSAVVRHLVARRPIDPGQRLDAAALDWQQTDISRLRRGYLDDPAEAAGMVATRRIPPGTTLTEAMLRKPWMVKRGDTVVLTAVGQGFRVSRNVEALDNGGLGSTIRLKTENNQILQGRVTGQDRLRVDF